MRNRRILQILSLTFLFRSALFAGEPIKPYLTDKPPVIDGVLDDEVWKKSPSFTGFKTFLPDFGKDMSQNTIVFSAYDSENLYFAFKCYDTEPDKIKASVTSRDNIRSEDWICINLDSFGNQQSLYGFYVNPFGIQEDSKFASNTEDIGIDLVWYSAGTIDSEGYVIEVQIPLKSIRYSDDNPVKMAVVFERKIARMNEMGSYPELDPAKGYAFLTQMHPILYYNVKHYTLFELLPAVTYSEKFSNSKGELKRSGTSRDLSLTLKYGITSDLILDGTYNPDFSQIEADAGQVDINLRYNLFYPEKRPFFLEGKENFWIAGTSINEIDPVRSIVHTRNIVDPIAGLKIAGKIGDENTIASIYAVDELSNPLPGEEKYTHFPIVRYKRALSKDSFVGGILVSREQKETYNRIVGVDGQIRITEAAQFEFNGLLTGTKPAAGAGNLSGNSFTLRYLVGTRNLDYDLSVKDVSENFSAETGYITRTGVLQFAGLLRPKFYPAGKVVQRIDTEVFSVQTRDKIFDKWETFNHASFQLTVFNRLVLRLKYNYATEIFAGNKFDISGLQVLAGGSFTNEFYLLGIFRRVNAIYYSSNPYQGYSNRFTASAIFQPSDKIRADISFIFYDFYRESDNLKIYEYPITRLKLTYQVNRYLFIRGITEYNNYRKQLFADFLTSFTYIPGTVIHLGYGSIFEKTDWQNDSYIASNNFHEMKRGFFFKASYLWRL